MKAITPYRKLQERVKDLQERVKDLEEISKGHQQQVGFLLTQLNVKEKYLQDFKNEVKEELKDFKDNDILDIRCTICLMEMTNPTILSCGHSFCYDCILKSFKKSSSTSVISFDTSSFSGSISLESVLLTISSISIPYSLNFLGPIP